VWLLLGAPHTLPPDELATLRGIQQDPEVTVSYDLAQQFLTIVRQRRVEHLDEWLAASAKSNVTELQTFAAGLHQDYPCVRAALTEVWSTGPVEGHINRLKLVKRHSDAPTSTCCGSGYSMRYNRARLVRENPKVDTSY
jgi:hypothetical protein